MPKNPHKLLIVASVLLLLSVAVNAVGEEEKLDIASLQKIAAEGNPQAQNLLGFLYPTGQGIEQDDAKSLLGIARPPSRESPTPSSMWVTSISAAEAFPRTNRKP